MTEELSDKEIKELEEKQLEITRQYSTPVDDASADGNSGNPGDGTQEGDGVQSGEAGNEAEQEPNMPWKDYPIDPATGYAVNPDTGEKVDPDTGQPVGENFSAFE